MAVTRHRREGTSPSCENQWRCVALANRSLEALVEFRECACLRFGRNNCEGGAPGSHIEKIQEYHYHGGFLVVFHCSGRKNAIWNLLGAAILVEAD
jgi:hypothetical protein